MNVLLINSPSRRGKSGLMIPLGLLYVAGIIERCGHSAKIIDPYLYEGFLESNCTEPEQIYRVIEEYKPSIVGYGGIATSYGVTKELSKGIRARYPEILQIVGGALSSVSKLLLTNTSIDLVFHGETEVSLPIFLANHAGMESIDETPGISYRKGQEIIQNPSPQQIKDLDAIPFPPYEIINLRSYVHNTADLLETYKVLIDNNPNLNYITNLTKNRSYIPIVTARGCTHRCLFCYRHFKGIRQHSVSYVMQHIKYLKNNYNIHGFQFVDELFNSNTEWVTELCDAIERENINIFYLIGGARIDKVNEKMLRRLKETGCIEINYGQESGSDTILKELRKGVTSQQNREITKLTTSLGLNCPVQLVIGSPKETSETIGETVQFLKDVGAHTYSLNYLIPLPGTPIWKDVEENHIITDVENYLEVVAEFGGSGPLVNLTRRPDREWRRWATIIKWKMQLYSYQQTKKLSFLINFIISALLSGLLYFYPKKVLKKIIPSRLGKFLKRTI